MQIWYIIIAKGSSDQTLTRRNHSFGSKSSGYTLHLSLSLLTVSFHNNNQEGVHELMHLFSDRGTPASLRHINAYSGHTYKFTKEVFLPTASFCPGTFLTEESKLTVP